MTAQAITAKKTGGTPVTVNYDLGSNLDEAVAKFGAEIVFTKFKQSVIIDAQALVRRLITPNKEGKVSSAKEVQDTLSAWKPDNRVVTKQSASEKATAAIGAMTPEERKELLKKLKAEGLV